MLTTEELKRYNRHIILPEFGLAGQEKLKQSSVLVIGAGGLGCPILQYLAAAGVGKIGVVDFDTVDASNLQRQVLFNVEDIGRAKAEVAVERLAKQNPYIELIPITCKLDSSNALEIFEAYDLVVDGSDNFATRYLVNDASVILSKPLVFGAIFKFEGQVSVFNYDGGPTYRCLFPTPPGPGEVPSCSEIGVVGVLPGIIGTIQATEAIKVLTGVGEPLSGKIFTLNALTMASQQFSFGLNPDNIELKELIDYELFCGIQKEKKDVSEQISTDEFAELKESSSNFELLDVREDFERQICSLGGIHIPMGMVSSKLAELPRDKTLVVYCHHGIRSLDIVRILRDEYGFNNALSLEGGIDAWAEEFDSSLDRY